MCFFSVIFQEVTAAADADDHLPHTIEEAAAVVVAVQEEEGIIVQDPDLIHLVSKKKIREIDLFDFTSFYLFFIGLKLSPIYNCFFPYSLLYIVATRSTDRRW